MTSKLLHNNKYEALGINFWQSQKDLWLAETFFKLSLNETLTIERMSLLIKLDDLFVNNFSRLQQQHWQLHQHWQRRQQRYCSQHEYHTLSITTHATRTTHTTRPKSTTHPTLTTHTKRKPTQHTHKQSFHHQQRELCENRRNQQRWHNPKRWHDWKHGLIVCLRRLRLKVWGKLQLAVL